ncbi:MAG: DUF4116 domain-containing protein [Syntrophomonadaceae bacterium]|nr:DUF4116 domain-containing protein [Syntrophomonadaceae bacterium]
MKIKFYGFLSIEVALAAVQRNGYALQYVPESLMTEPVALAAVQRNCDALQYVLNIDLFKRIADALSIDIEI